MKRLNFNLRNHLGENFIMSIYFCFDHDDNYLGEDRYLIYTHTHQGNQTEGTYLLNYALINRLNLVLFDFRASGYSTGKYVTLGWFEALDINRVCRFLKINANA